ncbi:MAG: right-handed parallel beta-helix repeat-containing protein [Candidatus Omnitrophica bacterium]|nr:right-handed parallel beta-helix repeat-containing protein [Candidatus Omnitrophota bacterium]
MNSKLITHHSKLRTLFFWLLAVSYGLLTFDCGQVFARLEVPADVRSETLIFNPQDPAPSSPAEGQVYYDDNDDKPYYYDGTAWQEFSSAGGDDAAIVARIVAASDSVDTTRADYVCDGTDDQVEIQAAIDDLGTNGGAVYLLEGTYNISASINLDSTAPDDSGKAIIGTGKGTVLKIASGASSVSAIYVYLIDGILISQLMIDGNSQTGTNNNGIHLHAAYYSKINNVWIEDMNGTGIIINSGSGPSYGNIITDNNIGYNAGYGIYTYSNYYIYYQVISNNIITDNSKGGIYAKTNSAGCAARFNYNTISDNIIQNGGTGINIDGSGEQARNNIILNNIIQANNGNGINLYYSVFNVVCNNYISSNIGNGIGLERGCWIDETFCSETILLYGYNLISGNTIANNTYKGIRLSDSNANVIAGNIIFDNNGSGGERSNIYITGSKNIITSNRIMNSLAAVENGIRLWSGSDNYLNGNMITGTFSGSIYAAPVYDNGINTQYTDKTRITLEPGSGYTGLVNGSTLTPDGPTSYLRLSPLGDVSLGSPGIAAGKSAGDILILENTTAFMVRLSTDASTRLHTNPLDLYQNDILMLIWNGTAWVETGYADN